MISRMDFDFTKYWISKKFKTLLILFLCKSYKNNNCNRFSYCINFFTVNFCSDYTGRSSRQMMIELISCRAGISRRVITRVHATLNL